MTKIDDLMDLAIERMLMPPDMERHVLVHGRVIPKLTAIRRNGTVVFTLDQRFGLEVPDEFALPVAAFVAQAMAIGAGYPSASAESRDKPFAPQVGRMEADNG